VNFVSKLFVNECRQFPFSCSRAKHSKKYLLGVSSLLGFHVCDHVTKTMNIHILVLVLIVAYMDRCFLFI